MDNCLMLFQFKLFFMEWTSRTTCAKLWCPPLIMCTHDRCYERNRRYGPIQNVVGCLIIRFFKFYFISLVLCLLSGLRIFWLFSDIYCSGSVFFSVFHVIYYICLKDISANLKKKMITDNNHETVVHNQTKEQQQK